MSNWKSNIIKGLKVLSILFFGALFIIVMIAASNCKDKILVSDIVVDIDADESGMYFLEETDIVDLITKENTVVLINQTLEDVDLSDIEATIKKHNFVENAEVFSNFDGKIKVKITQKRPQYRIFNNKGVSYFISESGSYMPLSNKFTPRVIVATGKIPFEKQVAQDVLNSDLKKLIDFIQEDEFLNAFIGSIHVDNDGEFILIPKIMGHEIEFGGIEDLTEKFKRLKIFYKKALLFTEWEKYSVINLKYQGQIICSKK